MEVFEVSNEPFLEEMLSRDSEPAFRLLLFIDSLLDLIRISAQSRFLLFSLPVREAWLEAVQSLDEGRLHELRAGLLEQVSVAPGPRPALLEVGLAGPELDAKLEGYAAARRHFHVRGGVSNLRRALRWAKSILGSLTKALPFAEFLLELIEFAENGAEDIRDLEAGRL